MNRTKDILEKLLIDIETDLPALLTLSGLTDFSIYKIGGSKNPKELGFFIYQDSAKYGLDSNMISIIFQMQLYQLSELEAAKYQDVLTDYLTDYKPYDLGCDTLESINADSWPIEQTGTTFIYVICNWMQNLDSCD